MIAKDLTASREAGDDQDQVDADASGDSERDRITAASAQASAAQPKGFTLDQVHVKTGIPSLLHGVLRECQHIGLDSINKQLINRLHGVLRPFLLRRFKKDVAKQLPAKHEHVVQCRLSKRQRFLYEDFMSRSSTQESIASGNNTKLLNVLMQLRKVCNHPDLFATQPIVTLFDVTPIFFRTSSMVVRLKDELRGNSFDSELLLVCHEQHSTFEAESLHTLKSSSCDFVQCQ